VIVADAGRGKTALCELVAYMAARGQIRRQGSRWEPVIVRGTGFNGDLIKAVAGELRFREAWVSEAIAQHQIEARRLLLILDGISEMNPGHIAGLVTSLKGLGKQTYLATSRSELLPTFGEALSATATTHLLDVNGEAELHFFAAYTGSEEKAQRLLNEHVAVFKD
jgi:hypothetical protein